MCLSRAYDTTVSDLFEQGNEALGSNEANNLFAAISSYKTALSLLVSQSDDDVNMSKDDTEMMLSLYINLGTAYSSVMEAGQEDRAIEAYKEALLVHKDYSTNPKNKKNKDLDDLAAQAAFFLGMIYQDTGEYRFAADAYAMAGTLDEYHWAALGNLGSVLQDHMKNPREAMLAYNKAYQIMTEDYMKATDMPENPAPILSQLQYRIGLAINASPDHKCVLQDDIDTPRDCKELATHAFSLATKYDPQNEPAKHMLASITADATMTRASNTYVTSLFDDYAANFEHSLVQDLGYTGYERLRRGFDRAFGGAEKVPSFPLVVDAGCGTGLVGEQFRNVSQHLIGVDLSAAIINEAKKARPGLYDETRIGDVTQVYRDVKPISLIIAGDSYIYFGDLNELFASMKEGLANGGFAAFTLENVSKETEMQLGKSKSDWRWQLTPSGRFAHRKAYVEEMAMHHSLRIIHYEELIDFRFENGIGVRGHIFVLQKQTNSKE
eukprot:CAMPEP_0196815820 /NCGR_PEP_ID=MMETSP1362-20130617/52083_1 /TAXON_ID=163516 /ORGANISM="Leptocylindrus danicus, Strain CCMP1856" /LENGTH=493 /DNA_ID=CAMNT_0042192937 /DNA_START=113 /DNA_END=1591 /DNA_ORIENTATION=+